MCSGLSLIGHAARDVARGQACEERISRKRAQGVRNALIQEMSRGEILVGLVDDRLRHPAFPTHVIWPRKGDDHGYCFFYVKRRQAELCICSPLAQSHE